VLILDAARGRARAVWTDRRGGVSTGVYASANLALHVGDDPAAVAENRARLAAGLRLPPPDEWVWPEQVHGFAVAVVDGPGRPEATDAAVTTTTGLPLALVTADCAPIALLAPDAVGVVHAGWPGLLSGVVGEAVARLREHTAGPVHAVLGPCITAGRYEFGRDGLDTLVAHLGPTVEAVTDWGTPAFDVHAAVRIALERAGVDSLDDPCLCTASDPGLFSYRRDGVTGRQAVVAWLEA
jgi:YfiH family protein